eukprot:gene15467-21551_t
MLHSQGLLTAKPGKPRPTTSHVRCDSRYAMPHHLPSGTQDAGASLTSPMQLKYNSIDSDKKRRMVQARASMGEQNPVNSPLSEYGGVRAVKASTWGGPSPLPPDSPPVQKLPQGGGKVPRGAANAPASILPGWQRGTGMEDPFLNKIKYDDSPIDRAFITLIPVQANQQHRTTPAPSPSFSQAATDSSQLQAPIFSQAASDSSQLQAPSFSKPATAQPLYTEVLQAHSCALLGHKLLLKAEHPKTGCPYKGQDAEEAKVNTMKSVSWPVGTKGT